MKYRHTVKVSFHDGGYLVTTINGTEQEIRDYYRIGCVFNIGNAEDHLVRVVKVEFLD